MPKYILTYAQTHETFRFPELAELQKLMSVQIVILHEYYEPTIPLVFVECESEDKITRLVSRSVLIKRVVEYWAEGETLDQLESFYMSNTPKEVYSNSSHKILIDGVGRSFSLPEQVEFIEKLNFFGLKGKIDLKTPEQTFNLFIDYGPLFISVDDLSLNEKNNLPQLKLKPTATNKKKSKFLKNTNLVSTKTVKPEINSYRKLYFGRELTSAPTSRHLMNKYNLKTRKYLGNTSMEAEMSLIAANMANAAPGKLVYDPFVGTGSLLLVCSEFGAYTFGSDIDGRQIRGTAGFRTGIGGISTNIEEYNLKPLVLGNFIADITHCPIRKHPFLDAILTDPPYGVRAGAKKLGRKVGTSSHRSLQLIDGVPNHQRQDYYPPTEAYEMSDVIVDLLDFAATFLVVGGRLVFWLPTVTEEYRESDIPLNKHLKLVANSEQNFGAWTRRLITMEKIEYNQVQNQNQNQDHMHEQSHSKPKITSEDLDSLVPPSANIKNPNATDSRETVEHTPTDTDPVANDSPAHKNFRLKYFSKFEQSPSC